MQCRTSLLVYDVTKEHFGFWCFPEREAFRADVGTRIEGLRDCVANGLIEIYPNSRLEDKSCTATVPLNLSECKFDDQSFLHTTQAIATQAGHDLWEAEFKPDWTRYWHTDNVPDSAGNETQLYVAYASDSILNDLVKWLPDYFLLDAAYGLRETGCHTVFQYQVSGRKILPFVKVISWMVRLDNTFSTILASAQGATDASVIQAHRQQMSEFFQTIGRRQSDARVVLTRLSNKWDCVLEPGGGDHDTVAVERPTDGVQLLQSRCPAE